MKIKEKVNSLITGDLLRNSTFCHNLKLKQRVSLYMTQYQILKDC
jgi:hypothetical protein